MCCLADIIFCIYLYQRWIYCVDPTRVNEFGTSGEMLESGGQNGTVPAIESEAAAESNAEEAGDTLDLSLEPVKSDTEKKDD